MYALSLLQPWASLVVMDVKTIETRKWQTAHRGPLLIHAGQRKAGSVIAEELPIKKWTPSFRQLPFGAIIGQVNLVDIRPVESLHLSSSALATATLELNVFGDETLNKYAWIFEDAMLFNKPIPARGHLYLWSYHLDKLA